MSDSLYEYIMPGASHWSFRLRRGMQLKMTDVSGGANVGMLFYNPEDLLERYNAPDTLKCQHTFKLSKGNCLYSDMGRIFCSIVEDDFGWHDTVCGVSNKQQVEKKWGELNYQQARNRRFQNGLDSFLVELAKYGLGQRDLAMNVNWFSKTVVDNDGNLKLAEPSQKGQSVSLRFEMDTLVILHNCPHPLNSNDSYPFNKVMFEFEKASPVEQDDYCMNFRPENKRGFENNKLYHFGI